MATAIGDLVVRLGMNSKPFNSGISSASASLAKFAKFAAAGLAAAGTALAGGSFLKLGGSIAAEAEQAEIAFKTMLGSASEAKGTFAALTDFAAKTPFELPEITEAARGLIMFGERGQGLMNTLKVLGDAAAGTGTDFAELTLIYNQIRGTGKLLTQDFRQLSQRGVLSMQDIADYYGVATSAAQKMISDGKVGFTDVRKILDKLTGTGERFANMMEEQSSSMKGLLSTLKDNFGLLAADVFRAFMPDMKAGITSLISTIEKIREPVVKAALAFKVFASTAIGIVSEAARNIWTALSVLVQPLSDFFRPLIDGAITAFKAVVANLDVMLGSVDGFKAGAVNILYQTLYAFQAIWEQSKNYFLTTWEGISGWWSTFWLNMQSVMISNMMPGFARIGLEIQKLLTKLTGGEWNMTPEQEAMFVNVAQRSAMADLSKRRQEAEAATNGRLEELRQQHEQRMAEIGGKSQAQTEAWLQQMGVLPTLSGQVQSAWDKANAKGTFSDGQAGTSDGAATGKAKSLYSSAMERGSADAYSAIVQAMGGSGKDKIAKEQLTVEKGQLDALKTMLTLIGVPQSVVSIPLG